MNTDDIKNYFKIRKEISKCCKKYFENNRPFEAAEYVGWEFINEKTIEITYSYADYYFNVDLIVEYDVIEIPIEEILNYEKKNTMG